MADLEWDYAYIDLHPDKTIHPWTSSSDGQKHDLGVHSDRRENSVNMNLEVEDPLYAKVQRRSKNNVDRGRHHQRAVAMAANTSAAHLLALSYGAGAGRAAAVIQRAYRAHRLQSQFSRLMSLAMSADRLDRRLSLLGPGNYRMKDRHVV